MNCLNLIQKSSVIAVAAGLVLLAASPRVVVAADSSGAPVVAQGRAAEPRELEPRYKPVPPEEKSSYNDSYIFGMTRGLADSTIHPAAKAPLFLFTVPLDLIFFPFAAIGGFFG
jgi:hypothetical protein